MAVIDLGNGPLSVNFALLGQGSQAGDDQSSQGPDYQPAFGPRLSRIVHDLALFANRHRKNLPSFAWFL
jgi:hypothetical protein